MRALKQIKTVISAGVISFGAVLVLSSAAYAASGNIAINETNFPDDNFREWVSNNADATPDGVLTPSEIKLVTEIDCSNCNIADLTGIKNFTYLVDLNCQNNVLEELDISDMLYLENFEAGHNILNRIDASNCKKLTFHDVYWMYNVVSVDMIMGNWEYFDNLIGHCYFQYNPLKTIDFSGCTSLSFFKGGNDTLTNVNFQGCTALKTVELGGKQLDSLNVIGCSNLEELHVGENDMDSLVLTGCNKLKVLEAYDNNLKTIDLSPCTKLEELNLNLNELTNIDVSNNKALVMFWCKENQLSSLDVSNHVALVDFSCRYNNIKTLNLSGCKKLTDLSYIYEDNPLVDLNLTDCISLNEFTIRNTTLSKVNLTGCSALLYVDLSDNHIGNIILSGCDHLTNLDINDNNLKTLDLSDCKRLETLDCRYNYLTSEPQGLQSLQFYPQKIVQVPDAFKGTLKGDDVNLSWNELKDDRADGYEIYRSMSPDSGFELVKSYSDSDYDSYRDEDVEAGKTYYYKIRAYVSINSEKYYSNYSSAVAVKTALPTPTDTPTPSPTTPSIPTDDPKDTPTKAPSASIKINKETATVVCGESLALAATVNGTSSDVSWTSSNKKIAKVDSNGKVTTKQAGTVTITATVDGVSASCKVTVLYKDVTSTKDFWYKPTNYLTEYGVVEGYDKKTLFKPANDCTRAQMLTFMWRLSGSPTPESKKCKFPDVKDKDYFYKPVLWAVENGITTGYKDGKFKPKNVCTRAQTVTFLWRMAGKPAPETTKNKFKDVKKKDYFYKPVLWASEMKIVAGYKDNTFRPQGKCLRRQMVTFLYKYDIYFNSNS